MKQVLIRLFAVMAFALLGTSICAAQAAESDTNHDAHHAPNLGVEIDRVDVIGVKIFSSTDIENVLEIGSGDRLERLKVLRTEENLQALYVRHGYEEVSIRSRLVRKKDQKKTSETVLEFSIKEGRPFRIASIKLVQVGQGDVRTQSLWKSRIHELSKKFGLFVGDIYDLDKLGEGKRAIQEVLASDQFIGSKVDDYRASVAVPSALAHELVKNGDVAGWVSIELRIDLGERVSFGFRGNSVFTYGHLDGLVSEQRLLGLGKDYVGAIRSKLEEEYHSAGYPRVEVAPYTFETGTQIERKVTYFINEGPRVRIDSVDFDGNSVFPTEELRKLFFAKSSQLVQRDIYVEKDIQRSAELLIEAMKEKGYLSARLVTINAVYPAKPKTQQQNSSVKLLVYLYEGDQTLVEGVTVQGASVLSEADIQRILQIHMDEPLNLFALGEGIDAIKKIYRDRGYLGFRLINEGTNSLVQYSQENRVARINLQVDEGPLFRVSHIEVEGLTYTHENIVRRELSIFVGEVLKEKDLILSERKLRKLGIFSSVLIKAMDDPVTPGVKLVRISLKEADRGVLTYGPGFRNDLGVRFYGQLSYSNLWDENHTLSISASVNRRFNTYNFGEGQAQISYVWPWFGVRELNFRPTIDISRTQYYNFNADSLIAAVNWDKAISSSPVVMGYVSYTFEKIFQGGAINMIDEGGFQIATVTPKVSIDLRNSPLAPTSGFFSIAWLDLALPFFGSQETIGYYRAQIRNDYYLPIFQDIVCYFSFRTGFEQALNSSYFIPLIKEFALGGIASIRGYQEQGINNPYRLVGGSLSYVNYRVQVDLPFSGALKFGVFLDAGNLLVNNFSLGGLTFGTGFGFHYQTPVGPINFDWGFKVSPPAGVDPYIIHVSVGVI